MLQLIYLIGRRRSVTFTAPVVCSYLQVEWEVRRGTARLFTPDTMRSSNCRVPQQDNSSDCGLYLLQYAESFLQVPHRTAPHYGIRETEGVQQARWSRLSLLVYFYYFFFFTAQGDVL